MQRGQVNIYQFNVCVQWSCSLPSDMDAVLSCCQLGHHVLDLDQGVQMLERELAFARDLLELALVEQRWTQVLPPIVQVKLVERDRIETLHDNAFQEPDASVELSTESRVLYPEFPKLECHQCFLGIVHDTVILLCNVVMFTTETFTLFTHLGEGRSLFVDCMQKGPGVGGSHLCTFFRYTLRDRTLLIQKSE